MLQSCPKIHLLRSCLLDLRLLPPVILSDRAGA
jgi:hypothetical protein